MKPKEEKKKSLVWTLFNDVKGKDLAKCTICGNEYSTKGGSTSTMNAHLEKKHPQAFQLKKKEREEESIGAQQSDGKSQTIVEVLQNQGRQETSPEKKKKELSTYKTFCVSNKKLPNLSEEPDYIFKFWAESGKEFKYLKKLAEIVLSTPSSSIESERLFSLAGLISANKLRNRLSAKLEKLCFIIANKKHGLMDNKRLADSNDLLTQYGSYFANRLSNDSGEEETVEDTDGELSDED